MEEEVVGDDMFPSELLGTPLAFQQNGVSTCIGGVCETKKLPHAPEEVEGDAADARVEDILDEDVHHVLGAHGAGAQLQQGVRGGEMKGQRQQSVSTNRALRSPDLPRRFLGWSNLVR